jgi:hypothetical protein
MASDHLWAETEDGLWCECCGNHIAARWHLDDEDYTPPDECRQCGFPDPEAVAEYHCGD